MMMRQPDDPGPRSFFTDTMAMRAEALKARKEISFWQVIAALGWGFFVLALGALILERS